MLFRLWVSSQVMKNSLFSYYWGGEQYRNHIAFYRKSGNFTQNWPWPSSFTLKLTNTKQKYWPLQPLTLYLGLFGTVLTPSLPHSPAFRRSENDHPMDWTSQFKVIIQVVFNFVLQFSSNVCLEIEQMIFYKELSIKSKSTFILSSLSYWKWLCWVRF